MLTSLTILDKNGAAEPVAQFKAYLDSLGTTAKAEDPKSLARRNRAATALRFMQAGA